MPQISVYIPDELFIELVKAGDKSKTIQIALKEHFKKKR